MNWPKEIATLVAVKQALGEVDRKGLWPHHLPAVGAGRSDMEAAERQLGRAIDPAFRTFLSYANGWRGVYQTVDLFGTDDFAGSARWLSAIDMIAALDSDMLRSFGVDRETLTPVAATSLDRDLFVQLPFLPGTHSEVLWFSGDLVDRFASFDEFFLAMVDYNRSEIEYLKQSSH